MELVGVAVVSLYGTLYALVHSLLASVTVKAAARRVFGPGADRWYRLGFTALAVAALVPINSIMAQFPDRELYSLTGPWQYLVLACRVASVAGLVYSISVADIWRFLGLRQAGLAPARGTAEGSELVTSGIYGWVRHPDYLFALGVFWFLPRMTLLQLALCGVFTAYLAIGSLFEERRLILEFGAAYLEYRQRVPRLLPFRVPLRHGEDSREAGVGDPGRS